MNEEQTIKEFELKLHELAKQGLLISISYGLAKHNYLYSVTILNQNTMEFVDEAFAVDSLCHALEVAEKESIKQGWIKKEDLNCEQTG